MVGYFYIMYLIASKLGKENAGWLCFYSISFHYPSCGVTKILAVPCLGDICDPFQGGSWHCFSVKYESNITISKFNFNNYINMTRFSGTAKENNNGP